MSEILQEKRRNQKSTFELGKKQHFISNIYPEGKNSMRHIVKYRRVLSGPSSLMGTIIFAILEKAHFTQDANVIQRLFTMFIKCEKEIIIGKLNLDYRAFIQIKDFLHTLVGHWMYGKYSLKEIIRRAPNLFMLLIGSLHLMIKCRMPNNQCTEFYHKNLIQIIYDNLGYGILLHLYSTQSMKIHAERKSKNIEILLHEEEPIILYNLDEIKQIRELKESIYKNQEEENNKFAQLISDIIYSSGLVAGQHNEYYDHLITNCEKLYMHCFIRKDTIFGPKIRKLLKGFSISDDNIGSNYLLFQMESRNREGMKKELESSNIQGGQPPKKCNNCFGFPAQGSYVVNVDGRSWICRDCIFNHVQIVWNQLDRHLHSPVSAFKLLEPIQFIDNLYMASTNYKKWCQNEYIRAKQVTATEMNPKQEPVGMFKESVNDKRLAPIDTKLGELPIAIERVISLDLKETNTDTNTGGGNPATYSGDPVLLEYYNNKKSHPNIGLEPIDEDDAEHTPNIQFPPPKFGAPFPPKHGEEKKYESPMNEPGLPDYHNPKNMPCQVCGDMCKLEKIVELLNCHHQICINCIYRNITEKISRPGTTIHDLKCIFQGCDRLLDMKNLEYIIGNELAEAINERTTLSMQNR